MLRTLALTLAIAASPAFAEMVTVDTYAGPTDVAASPGKIAVFDIAALDTMAALGVKPAGVVSNVYVDYLDDATKDAVSIGSLFEPDFEAVAALKPDLIVAGGRSSKLVPDLAKIAPTVDMTIWEDTVGQGLDRLVAFGKIFDKQDEAAALKSEFEARLAAVQVALEGQGDALIVMTNGPKVSAYGAAGRFGWLHKSLGLPEAVEAVEHSTHGEAISFEFIRDADPEILIVIDRLAAIGQDGDSAQTTLDNALVHETTAWKNGNVIYLDSARVYIAGGGIQSMMHILDQFASTLSAG
jgi:iron-siderophore transport system substrate-binding protein